MQSQYSLRSPAVKRLMKEAQELREPTEQYHAHPLDDNLFEWHFTIRGPEESDFQRGVYHGRIILPPDYPMKPPSIILLTSNGRFETNKKICLSISGHHPESWQPSWSIRTALLAIIGFMPTHGGGAIGSLDYTSDERKILAKRSNDYKCSNCGHIKSVLKPVTAASDAAKKEAKELASQIAFQAEKEKGKGESSNSAPSNTQDGQPQQQPQAMPYNMQQFAQFFMQGQAPPGYQPTFPYFAPPFPPGSFPAGSAPGWPPAMNVPNLEAGQVQGQSPAACHDEQEQTVQAESESSQLPDEPNPEEPNKSDETHDTDMGSDVPNDNEETRTLNDVEDNNQTSESPEVTTSGLRNRNISTAAAHQNRHGDSLYRTDVHTGYSDSCTFALALFISMALLVLIIRRMSMSQAWISGFY